MSETKWSEKDRVLPRRNSGETQFGRDAIRARHNSGETQFGRGVIREAKKLFKC
ncbi:hypothetical protein [Methanosarcina sp. DH2]|uniref:hypothetical protein n=1 Tax=Methanosarcina sp. DH2 TaxID=2605639 RepID=UPI001E3CC8C7|nr:hypothetical protein [Methanosarcina sp. DH2]